MEITIIDPQSLIRGFDKHWKVHNYFTKFIKKYKPSVYFTSPKQYLVLLQYCAKTNINILELRILPTVKSLRNYSDILFFPWGMGDIKKIERIQSLFRVFDGMKIFHVMDHQNLAYECNEFLESSGVDYVMGYNRHDLHSPFFQMMYPRYIGKVIDVPFGFDDTWAVHKSFHERTDKCLGAGTIESLEWVRKSYSHRVRDYLDYYSADYHSMHELRYLVNRERKKLGNIIDCKFNDVSKSINTNESKKHYSFFVEDVVGLFNNYKMFLNDESLLNFPPIRTYEGIAAGCVMVCHKDDSYTDYGFRDGETCIMFEKYNLDEMEEKIIYYLYQAPEKLEAIQERSVNYVRENFNHAVIADMMYSKIRSAFLAKSANGIH